MKKLLLTWLLSGLTFIFSCKKNTDVNNTGFDVKIYSTNNKNIIADYTAGNLTYQYYGTFRPDGMPDRINAYSIKHEDTLLNVLLDTKYRIQDLYYNYKGTRDTFFYHMAYLGDSVMIISLMSQRWDNSSAKFYRSATVKLFSDGNVRLTEFHRGSEEPQDVFEQIPDPEQSFSDWLSEKKKSLFNKVATATKTLVDAVAVLTCAATASPFVTLVTGVTPPGLLVYAGATAVCAATTMFNKEIKSSIDKNLGVKADEDFSVSADTPTPVSPTSNLQTDKVNIEKTYTITVDSKSAWVDSGVDIGPTEDYSIGCVEGAWSVDSTNYPKVFGEGHTNEASTLLGGFPGAKTLQGVFYGALLGKINTTVFKIGALYSGPPLPSGRLYLQINDELRNDNAGKMVVWIVRKK